MQQTMRALTTLALVLLGVAVAGALWVVSAEWALPGNRTDNGLALPPFFGFVVLMGLVGLIPALIATLLGLLRAAKRHQWGWLMGLVGGFLLPAPAGVAVTLLLVMPLPWAITRAALRLDYVPTFAGFLLTPVTALVYSVQHNGHGPGGQ